MPIISTTAFTTITIIHSVTEVIEFVITEFNNIYSVREKTIPLFREKNGTQGNSFLSSILSCLKVKLKGLNWY